MQYGHMQYRQTWAEINLDAIYDNLSSLKRHFASGKQLLVSVKANGYGHGAVPIAKTALRAGADWLGVALLEEAVQLRQAGINAPILIFGCIPLDALPVAQFHRVHVTVPDLDYFKEMGAYLDPDQPPLHFHVKLDTGMGRLGLVSEKALEQMIVQYCRLSGTSEGHRLSWTGVYSHLATADERDEEYLVKQVEQFDQRVEQILANGIQLAHIHLANSAGLIRRCMGQRATMARLGISLYGLLPSAWMADLLPFQLRPALSLHTRISQVKQVDPGHGISYGCTYVAREKEWIATLPIGYADGYSRSLSNQAHVLIGGRRYPVVGRVCMDQTMVKLDQPYSPGELVTLVGRQGREQVSLDELARLMGTINYEVPCLISTRVPRIYRGKKPLLKDLVSLGGNSG